MSDGEGSARMVPELEASLTQLPPPERAAPPPVQTESVRGPGAAPTAPGAAPVLPPLASLLVPADYVDVAALLRMRDRRQRQALLDALFRGCDLCYRM